MCALIDKGEPEILLTPLWMYQLAFGTSAGGQIHCTFPLCRRRHISHKDVLHGYNQNCRHVSPAVINVFMPSNPEGTSFHHVIDLMFIKTFHVKASVFMCFSENKARYTRSI
jgi:hypothetical protein